MVMHPVAVLVLIMLGNCCWSLEIAEPKQLRKSNRRVAQTGGDPPTTLDSSSLAVCNCSESHLRTLGPERVLPGSMIPDSLTLKGSLTRLPLM